MDFLVCIFNPQGDSWNIPKITGNISTRKSGLTGIIDHKGIMYLWGGYYGHVGVPITREFYVAVLLPDNSIIYIGGYDNAKELPLSLKNVRIAWNTTSGIVPSDRDGLSAVLGLDGQRVIIFGGSTNYGVNTGKDLIYELNLINYELRIPKTLMYHKANVIGKYMEGGYDQSTESDILLLDISNVDEYIWTNELGFYLYRWNKNKHGDKNPYNNNNNQYQYDHGHEIMQPPNDEYTINHQHRSTPASVINRNQLQRLMTES
ncbi:hypothetical protein RclHR1_00050014 [Rhizophagus clarus]|uniref:Uncharacterized protein n=1 Tax=Rhizophagus clarus TaxID=94130 RepID=A0A2Z6RK49_9GLOM|nr:hypothetical protein RclHR1_00050014 [Rhizophagus clarus]